MCYILWSVRPCRRNFVGSELPEYFFLYQFALDKMACFTSLGFFSTSLSLLGILGIKIYANLHQFALTKGSCTKIKLMQKAHLAVFCINWTWFTIKNLKFALKNMKFTIKNIKFVIKKKESEKNSTRNTKFSIKNMTFSIKNTKFSV